GRELRPLGRTLGPTGRPPALPVRAPALAAPGSGRQGPDRPGAMDPRRTGRAGLAPGRPRRGGTGLARHSAGAERTFSVRSLGGAPRRLLARHQRLRRLGPARLRCPLRLSPGSLVGRHALLPARGFHRDPRRRHRPGGLRNQRRPRQPLAQHTGPVAGHDPRRPGGLSGTPAGGTPGQHRPATVVFLHPLDRPVSDPPSVQITRILAVRHSQTDWNRDTRIQGHTDIGLNAHGQSQAQRLASALRDETLVAIYASDLRRARATAEAVAVHHGLAVHTDPGLRERGFGRLEGLTWSEIETRHPAEALAWRKRHPAFTPPGGGESLLQLRERIVATVHTLAARHAGEQILIVTHGGVLDVL